MERNRKEKVTVGEEKGGVRGKQQEIMQTRKRTNNDVGRKDQMTVNEATKVMERKKAKQQQTTTWK